MRRIFLLLAVIWITVLAIPQFAGVPIDQAYSDLSGTPLPTAFNYLPLVARNAFPLATPPGATATTTASPTTTATPPTATATGTPTPTPTRTATPISTVVDVQAADFNFSPQVITVPAGTMVRWTNTGQAPHTVTGDTGLWNSGNLNSGQKFSFTFTQAGTYPYYCAYHGAPGGVGMSGRVVVTAPNVYH